MSRRGFLKALTAGAAGLVIAETIDLERLLWVPGETVAFCEGGGSYLFDDAFMCEAMAIVARNVRIAKHINRKYEQLYTVGDTIRIKLPRRFTGAVDLT